MLAQTGAAGLPAAGKVLITFGEESWAARGFGAAIGEVGEVVVRVDRTVAIAQGGRRVRDSRRSGAISEQFGAAVADEVVDQGTCRTRTRQKRGRAEERRPCRSSALIAIVPVASGSGSGIVPPAPGGLLDEVIPAGRDRP